jgi:hypothetical protein
VYTLPTRDDPREKANQVVVAIARELVGSIWAIAKQVTVTP